MREYNVVYVCPDCGRIVEHIFFSDYFDGVDYLDRVVSIKCPNCSCRLCSQDVYQVLEITDGELKEIYRM